MPQAFKLIAGGERFATPPEKDNENDADPARVVLPNEVRPFQGQTFAEPISGGIAKRLPPAIK